MTAGEYCNRDVAVIKPETSIVEAARLMRQYHVGALVVVDETSSGVAPIGILTDRDLVVEVMALEIHPESIAAKDVMSSEPISVSESTVLLDTLELMQTHGVRRILVVNESGVLQGILSTDDVLELIAEASNHLVNLVRKEINREQHIHP